MSQWPPTPDLDSIRELVRDAYVEGLIEIYGAPDDEYDTEAEAFHAAIARLPTAEITVANQLPILEAIWHKTSSTTTRNWFSSGLHSKPLLLR